MLCIVFQYLKVYNLHENDQFWETTYFLNFRDIYIHTYLAKTSIRRRSRIFHFCIFSIDVPNHKTPQIENTKKIISLDFWSLRKYFAFGLSFSFFKNALFVVIQHSGGRILDICPIMESLKYLCIRSSNNFWMKWMPNFNNSYFLSWEIGFRSHVASFFSSKASWKKHVTWLLKVQFRV